MRTLGLDLCGNVVRAVIGENRRGKLQLHEASTLPVPGATTDALATAVGTFLAEHGRGVQQVVIGLPLHQTVVKLLRFPTTSEDNLGRLARAAAETSLPLPVDLVSLDHGVIDTGDTDNPATVALAACRRDDLTRTLAPLAAAGVKVQVVDVSALALANAFHHVVVAAALTTAIVLLNGDRTEFVVLDGKGRLRQVRGISAGASEVADELRRSLQSYAGTMGEPVAQVLLAGTDAPRWETPLAEALGVPVQIGNAWNGNGMQEVDGEHAAAFAVATGLALRGGEAPLHVNLRVVDQTAPSRRAVKPAEVVMAGIVVLVMVAALWFWQAWNTRAATARQVADQVATLEKQVKLASSDDPAFLDKLQTKANQVRQESNWLDFLRDLSTRLPTGLAIEEINCDRARPLTVRGQALNNTVIAQAMDVLNAQGWFDGVRLDYANAERIGQQLVYNFQITCPWKEKAKEPGKTVKETG